MATGLENALAGASDVIHDYACTPCSEDAKNTEAVFHCVKCQMYYCLRCIGFHRKLFKSHTENETSALKPGKGATKQQRTAMKNAEQFPSDVCDLHPKEAIKMFCKAHDIVCCTVCIALHHRSCKDVDYIPNIAGKLLRGHEIQNSRQALENIKEDLQILKSRGRADLAKVHSEGENANKKMRNLKHSIISRVVEMERTSRENIRARQNMISEEINDSISSVDKSLKTIDEELNKMSLSTFDEATCFVRVKQGLRKALEGRSYYQQMKNRSFNSIAYEIHSNINALLYQPESFGFVVEYTDSPVKAKFLNELDIKVDSDYELPVLYDICTLKNEHLLVSDYKNDTLKRLDEKFKIIDCIDLSGGPRSICTVEGSKVAVTLYTDRKVVFVSVGDNMSSENTFDVDEHCRGICSRQDKLYICCGGHPSCDKSPGHIKVYNLAGTLLSTFDLTEQGNEITAFPVGIITSRDSSKLLIADAFQGFIALDAVSGRKISSFRNKNLQYSIGVCEDDRGHMFICNGHSNNVVEMDAHGNFIQEILTFQDGIVDPLWVSLLQNPKRLMVTCRYSSKIKVFCLV